MGDFFNWLLRSREANAHRRTMRQRFQTLQRESQMSATFIVGYSMNLVDNHGLDITQDRSALLRRQQDVQRLRRGHENVRRPLQHGPPLVHERIASADRSANLRHEEAALARHLQNLSKWYFEILLDIVAQRLQRRDVENFR